MSNQTFDRRPQSISVDTNDLAAPFSTAASKARSVILVSGWPLVVLLALALSSLAFFSAQNIIGLFHDDGIYVVVAKALSEGSGYRIISLPSDPYQTKYPFLYSQLLSWAWSLNPQFPDNVSLLNFVNVFFYFASLLLAYVLYVQNTMGGKADALLYVFLVGANASVFSITSYPLSDIPFMAAVLFCLTLSDPTNGFSIRTRSIVLLAVGAGSAFLFRNAGAALILAGLIYLLLARQRKQFYLYVIVVGCLIVPWVLWQAMYGPAAIENPLLAYYQSYESPAFFLAGSDPGLAVQIIGANLLYSARTVDSLMLLRALPELRAVIYPLMIWGFWSILRRQNRFFNGFILFYIVLILSWPWHPARYLMPLLPILLLSLFQGAQGATATIRPHATKAWSTAIIPFAVRIPIGIIVVFIIGWLSGYVSVDRSKYLVLWGGFRTSYGWSGFSESFTWIKQNTQNDDVLATAYDPMYYLYTGRKAVRPWIHRPETYFYPYGNATPDLGSVEEIRDTLQKLGVRFLIVDPLEGYSENAPAAELFEKLLRSYEVRPELVFQSSDGLHRIYALPAPQPKAVKLSNITATS
jgi:hypothetical protein